MVDEAGKTKRSGAPHPASLGVVLAASSSMIDAGLGDLRGSPLRRCWQQDEAQGPKPTGREWSEIDSRREIFYWTSGVPAQVAVDRYPFAASHNPGQDTTGHPPLVFSIVWHTQGCGCPMELHTLRYLGA